MDEDEFEGVAEQNRVFRETVASWREAGERAIEGEDFDGLARLHLQLLAFVESELAPLVTDVIASGFSLQEEGQDNG